MFERVLKKKHSNQQSNHLSSCYSVRMEQVAVEINFIKLCLGSFEKHQDENERKKYLKSKLEEVTNNEALGDQLIGYVRLSEDK